MAKDLIDIYKTLQSLSFHFGSTLSLSDLLSVSHKHAVLYSDYEVHTCTHVGVCVLLCVHHHGERRQSCWRWPRPIC